MLQNSSHVQSTDLSHDNKLSKKASLQSSFLGVAHCPGDPLRCRSKPAQVCLLHGFKEPNDAVDQAIINETLQSILSYGESRMYVLKYVLALNLPC